MEIDCKSMNMEQRKDAVANLVEKFRKDEKIYTSKDYLEARCRSEFIDLFLETLGWDVPNKMGVRPDRMDVIKEDDININNHIKHPDYTLCFGGIRKIFVEAKQPSIDLKQNPEPALQVRTYAYSQKLPIAILTDFQEFAIYDTRIEQTKP